MMLLKSKFRYEIPIFVKSISTLSILFTLFTLFLGSILPPSPEAFPPDSEEHEPIKNT